MPVSRDAIADPTNASATSEGAEIYAATYLAFPDEDPKRVEITITESLFPPFVGLTAHAIHDFDGTTLIFAGNEPGIAETPTEFVPGGGTRVWELTRPRRCAVRCGHLSGRLSRADAIAVIANERARR